MWDYIIYCPNKPREIKRFINLLLKQNIVKNIKRINYVKSFTKNSKWEIQKDEEKILIINWCDDIEKVVNISKWIIWEWVYLLK